MNKRLLFATATELVCLPADALVYVVADGNYSSLKMADGSEYILTMQLGFIERHLAQYLDKDDSRFIRIGKSLIINRDYITFINHSRQRLVLSDCRNFRHELSASREALKALREFVEKEAGK